jgi:hypothetical protein
MTVLSEVNEALNSQKAPVGLQNRRRELFRAAAAEWEGRWNQFRAGQGVLDFLLASSRRLLKAELVNAKNEADRNKAYKASLDRLTKIDAAIENLHAQGKVAAMDREESRFARVEAELEYAERIQNPK